MLFNLLPISPLDGFKVALGVLPRDWSDKLAQTESYGFIILILLIFLGRRLPILDLLIFQPSMALRALLVG